MLKNLISGLNELGVESVIFYFDSENRKTDFCCATKRIVFNSPIEFDAFDIIHCHCFRADLYASKWRKKMKRASLVCTIHENAYVDTRYIYPTAVAFVISRIWMRLYRKFNCVVCISNQLSEYYKKYLGATRIETIYNGVDIRTPSGTKTDSVIMERIRKLRETGYRLLGTYAKIVERKGIDQLIKILPEMPEYALVVIGDGPSKGDLITLSENLNVTDRVLFVPHLEYPYLYLKDIDVYCMPSYSEGFGLAMVESAMSGKPIVCSDIVSFHEIFPNQEAGFFEPNNHESLKGTIQRVYENKYEYQERGRKRCLNEFSYLAMANRYKSLYSDIISQDHNKGHAK